MLVFKPIMTVDATQLERGDNYDNSVVHLLDTLDAGGFWIEKKDGRWKVTTGTLSEVPDEPEKKKSQKKKDKR